MNETETMTPSAEFRFTSTDGVRVACARWDARTSVRGTVQIAHGMGEHIGRYVGLIEALVGAGLTVYGNDHRGHGRTAAQQYVLDHSREIDGLARLASAAPPGENLLNAPFEPARTPFEWLSRDTAVVDAFIDDPLCFAQLQPAAFGSFLGAAPRLCDPASLGKIRRDLPIYLFSGSDDPAVDDTKCSTRSTATMSGHAWLDGSQPSWNKGRVGNSAKRRSDDDDVQAFVGCRVRRHGARQSRPRGNHPPGVG